MKTKIITTSYSNSHLLLFLRKKISNKFSTILFLNLNEKKRSGQTKTYLTEEDDKKC